MQVSAPLIDVIDSSDTLLRFMEREEISSRDNPNELLPHHELLKHTNAIAREIVEGERALSFDLVAIPLSANPGRKAAVRLFIRIENRVRELRGENRKMPFYPLDSYVLLTHIDQVETWESRIFRFPLQQMTDWERLSLSMSTYFVSSLVSTKVYIASKYSGLSLSEVSELASNCNDDRIALMQIMYSAYLEFVMNVPDYPYTARSYSPGRPDDSTKEYAVEWVKQMTNLGVNPFDVLFYMSTERYKRDESYSSWLHLIIGFIGLALSVYACVSGHG
jgi:hypothetical protein